jgi:hypothetical protein
MQVQPGDETARQLSLTSTHCLKSCPVITEIFLYHVSENQIMSRKDQKSVSILCPYCEGLRVKEVFG